MRYEIAAEREHEKLKATASIWAIAEHACAITGVRMDVLLSPRRDAPTVYARNLTSYVAYKYGAFSLPKIAAALNRDHTSILHGISVFKDRFETDAEARTDVDLIVHRMKRRT